MSDEMTYNVSSVTLNPTIPSPISDAVFVFVLKHWSILY